MKESRRPVEVDESGRPTNWTIIALVAGLILLVSIIGYFAFTRNTEQDKLTNSQVSTSAPRTHEKLCASSRTYDLIKAELFRRAAQLRGTDQAAYDRIAASAVLRMENPVMESEDGSTGAVNCSGSLSLDLPPGVAAVGGRRTLMSDIDYTVQQAADGTGTVILLRNADAIITPLATLTRTEQPPAPPAAPTQENGVAPENPQPNAAQPTAAPAPAPAPAPTSATPLPRTTAARPSFNCTGARTSGERAVCSDSGLAALDRNMAAEYGRAVSVSSPDQRDLLRETAHRFYAYRDRCQSRRCIGDAYAGRIREIRDIVEGRWQPPR
jgi:hypothetical protein